MLSQKEIFGLARTVAGSNDVVAISMSLVRFTGSWTAGAILSQLLYWSDKTRISGGWICKTHEEWHEELMLTRDKVRPAIAMLKKSGILEVKMKKFDGAPKPHYHIVEKVFMTKFRAFLNHGVLLQSENPTVGKHDDRSEENPTINPTEIPQSTEGKSDEPITEITTEINSETTTENKKTPPEGDAGSEAPKQNKWEGTGQEEEQPTYVSGLPAEEEEKSSGKKEEEPISQRKLKERYQDAWWEFYKAQNKGKEPPFSWQNHYTLGGPLKEIQQDLAAEFDGNEERAYQEFVSILSGWQHPKNYHRHRLKPKQIHNHLEEIRGILSEYTGKTIDNHAKIPVLGEALEIFRQAHLEHRELLPNLNEARDLPLLAQTLEYLKGLQPERTWQDALTAFEFICQGWPVLEAQDKFYETNFTIKYIHGNTATIIARFKQRQQQEPNLSLDAAAAWASRNGFAQQR